MSAFFSQIFSLLTVTPGNLLYHIVLPFSMAGTLYACVRNLRSGLHPQARRTAFGLGVLLGLQLILFAASGLAWMGAFEAHQVMPPLDRLVTFLSLVWIAWIWIFPARHRYGDAAAVLLSVLGLILTGISLAVWARNTGMGFNLSAFETIWQVLSLGITLAGLLGLVLRKPDGWSNGLAMLVMLLIGHLGSLLWRMEGDFPGLVRFTQLASFPLLLLILQRFPAAGGLIQARAVKREDSFGGSAPESPTYSADPKTLHALMSLAAEDDPDKIGRALTRCIAQSMLADQCYLLTMDEDKSLTIACGYDLIREENLEGKLINREAIPQLANAIQRGRPLRFPVNSTSPDLKSLGDMLGLPNPGSLLSAPIKSRQREPLGSVVVLSPHSDRLWTAEDQSYLTNISTMVVPILERGVRASQLETEHGQVQEQAAEANRRYQEASQELEKAHENASQSQVQAENLAALLAMQEESERTIESLRAELSQLQQGAEPDFSPAGNSQLETELHQALEELARMQNTLAEANVKILELEQNPTSPISNEQVEVIASLSQELRQPMSSIVGYTDLLMGESVGTLGALQRKFVERIKSSTERIGGLVDDLIQITNLEAGKVEFKPEPIDLNLIIDNAMAYTSTQIREKNIALRLDIPEVAPRLRTDRDALQQILIHLLQNATTATQAEGIITLRVKLQKEAEKHYLAVQVTDTGGGISADDLPRVFARRYRAEHSLIQGLGDTGVGLSIARALVESLGGRIWVDTEAGRGSTFNTLLPVLIEAEEAA